MTEQSSTGPDEHLREAVKARLLVHYPRDRAATLYGYWQLLCSSGGPARLRSTLGPATYRETLAALAAAGIELPRLTAPGPVAGVEANPGSGVPATLTVERELIRQAILAGVFAWGDISGVIDLAYVRAGATGYGRDTIVASARLKGLLPATYHRLEVRSQPALLGAQAPILLRFGAYTSETGQLRFFVGLPAAPESLEVTTIFGTSPSQTEVILYRCYDGPAADDTSFIIARGILG